MNLAPTVWDLWKDCIVRLPDNGVSVQPVIKKPPLACHDVAHAPIKHGYRGRRVGDEQLQQFTALRQLLLSQAGSTEHRCRSKQDKASERSIQPRNPGGYAGRGEYSSGKEESCADRCGDVGRSMVAGRKHGGEADWGNIQDPDHDAQRRQDVADEDQKGGDRDADRCENTPWHAGPLNKRRSTHSQSGSLSTMTTAVCQVPAYIVQLNTKGLTLRSETNVRPLSS
jgi:hypothetical protein